jgi:DNA-binding NarL/FixJ family response regulator
MKILVFERQPELRRALLDWLERSLPGCTCLGTGEREEFLALCLEQRPHAAVMDAEFSALGGVTATYALRAIRPAMALVMFTARPDAPDDWLSLGPLDAFVPEHKLRTELAPTLSRLLSI